MKMHSDYARTKRNARPFPASFTTIKEFEVNYLKNLIYTTWALYLRPKISLCAHFWVYNKNELYKLVNWYPASLGRSSLSQSCHSVTHFSSWNAPTQHSFFYLLRFSTSFVFYHGAVTFIESLFRSVRVKFGYRTISLFYNSLDP